MIQCMLLVLAAGILTVAAHAAPLTQVGTLPFAVYDISSRGVAYGVDKANPRRVVRYDLVTQQRQDMASIPAGTIIQLWATSRPGELLALGRQSDASSRLYYSLTGASFVQVLDLGVPEVRFLMRGLKEVTLQGVRGFLAGEYNVNKARQSGGRNDTVTLWWSANGLQWRPLHIFNQGTHGIRHIHAIEQDPETLAIYLATGDRGTERAIIRWDGRSGWPAHSVTMPQLLQYPGFIGQTKVFRTMATDLLWSLQGIVSGQEQTILLSTHPEEKGMWLWSDDLQTSTRVLDYNGSGIRFGVMLDNGRQVWIDAGNQPRLDGSAGLQFYISQPSFVGRGSWVIQHGPDLPRPKKTIVDGFAQWQNTVYVGLAGRTTLWR